MAFVNVFMGLFEKRIHYSQQNIHVALYIPPILLLSLMVNHEDFCTRGEKQSSKLDVSRSFICIFAK
jgi:hypothetical protein